MLTFQVKNTNNNKKKKKKTSAFSKEKIPAKYLNDLNCQQLSIYEQQKLTAWLNVLLNLNV